jgi:hypothetical protein
MFVLKISIQAFFVSIDDRILFPPIKSILLFIEELKTGGRIRPETAMGKGRDACRDTFSERTREDL